MPKNRDEFSPNTKLTIAARSGHVCGNPECRATTTGPQVVDEKAINVGVAAHICAAAPGGARYDPTMSRVERGAAANGIWLCQTCSKLVDNDERRFPRELLLKWKVEAESLALNRIGKAQVGIVAQLGSVSALHQLPNPPANFTGRTLELTALTNALRDGKKILCLQGPGGFGKTSIALELTEVLRNDYPDAQFYFDLKGTSHLPRRPEEAMAHVIRGYYPNIPIPSDGDELAVQYRSVLEGKRALLLMDNAADELQIQPLFPPSSCVMAVTSRGRLSLSGMLAIDIQTLPRPDSIKLLLAIAPRISDHADYMAELCGDVPFALSVVAHILLKRIDLNLEDFMRRLADVEQRLKLTKFESCLTLSFDLMDGEMQRRWCMLGLFSRPFRIEAAAALWGFSSNSAALDVMGTLFGYNLVEWNSETSRYRLHDLSRIFAIERLAASDNSAGLDNLSTYYQKALYDASLARDFDIELLEGGVDTLRKALQMDKGKQDSEKLLQLRNNLGSSLLMLAERQQGTALFEEALVTFRESFSDALREKKPVEWADRQYNVGSALAKIGERKSDVPILKEAAGAFQEALGEYKDKAPEAWARTQNNLGNVYLQLGAIEANSGWPEKAEAAFRKALTVYTRERVPIAWAMTQQNLANLFGALGRLDEAASCHRQCLEVIAVASLPLDWATIQNNLGKALSELGRGKREPNLILDSVKCYISAWEIFSREKHYYGTLFAANGVTNALLALKIYFPSAYNECLSNHGESLRQMEILSRLETDDPKR